ncbi:retrovirus-related pol polyprotein from transposon TNT 1-94 [Tanacetum coccineum]
MEKLKDENVSLDFTVQSLIKERDNGKLKYQKLFNSIKKTRSQAQTEMDELIAHVSEKTYVYGAIRAENQNLLVIISELKTRLENVEKGMNVAASSVRRPMNRDSHVKNRVLANSKKPTKKVAVYVRKNKQTDNTSENVISNKENVIDVDVANISKAKTLLCVSFSKPKIDIGSTSKANDKVVQIVLWIVDSGFSKHMTGDRSLLKIFIEKFMGTVHFGNDNFAATTGYGDDLLIGGRESNLYTISISAWLLLHPLDFIDGLPKFKYGKDHLCSACKRGKSKKASHSLKLVPSDHPQLELIHMDLCGPMRVASINGKKYILMIVDDYSRYTWVYFLHSKDETPEIIKKFIAQAQLNYKAKVCKIRTDNGTEFKNVTLKAHYEKIGIMQQFSTARTPQQNGVVERSN